MKGSEANLLELMDGGKKYFVIPVYQRKYDWKQENCRQLYEDLKKVAHQGRTSHFFGSIVCSVEGNGSKIEYYVIDGQQRLTTVSLLLLAIRNLLVQHQITSSDPNLCDEIQDCYLLSKYSHDEDKFKMRLLKGDSDAFKRLFGEEEDFDLSSNLTHNYQFFRDMLLKQEVPVDDLYSAMGRLEVISITLDRYDNAQLIFESLNSTGLALNEGDKIRNFVLMNQPPREQDHLYHEYWLKIEQYTRGKVSAFVRDYLSVKRQLTPSLNAVYRDFKSYAEGSNQTVENLLKDMTEYARLYEKLLTGQSGLKEAAQLDQCMARMNWLEITVTRPFLMEVLRLNKTGKLNEQEVYQVFRIVENYLFRRNICEVPTNALNKVFLNLNREILRYDGTTDRYVDKLIYALVSKRDSGRFPDDEEFTAALSAKQVYQMRGKYKAYLFERFENFGTVETKDVFDHLANNVYTIEHIMPQHLTPAWTEALGPQYAQIHAEWLHRLANLTLTGYNPDLSNKTFQEKRDAEKGYKNSGLRMNQSIAQKDHWGLAELQERNQKMVEQAKKIWSYPSTDYHPAQQELESCTLDDEDADLTGRVLQRYSYQTVEQPAASWADMFEYMVKYLHQKDKSVLYQIARDSDSDLSSYVNADPAKLRMPLKIDDHLYMEKNTSTATKLGLLRKLFALYQANPNDLIFYLRDSDSGQAAESARSDLRLRYWTYALPIIQKQNLRRGIFSGVKPNTYNSLSGFFGISGASIACIANADGARVSFYLGTSDAAKNKADFDKLAAHKSEIESAVGVTLNWDRADQNKMSWISYSLTGVSINHPEDWPRMAKFHAEWSEKLCSAFLPILKPLTPKEKQMEEIAGDLREWSVSRQDIQVNLARSSRSYIRFTTPDMSGILPDLPDALSSWGTPNHYFYEVLNLAGTELRINFVINAHNAPDSFLELCDQINEFYPAPIQADDWQWRTPFHTSTFQLPDPLDHDVLLSGVEHLLQEVFAFESDLKAKLNAKVKESKES